MAEEADDSDLRVLRASEKAINDLRKKIDRLSVPDCNKMGLQRVTSISKGIAELLDIFQEDPQLLDPHLKVLLPPLVDQYLKVIQSSEFQNSDLASVARATAISKTLNVFCKVRGRRVVSRFLTNEPRYVEPFFGALAVLGDVTSADATQTTGNPTEAGVSTSAPASQQWEQYYIVLLWLSQLILTPFDLSTISSGLQSDVSIPGISLEHHLPSIAQNAIRASLTSLNSATSARVVAADLLVNLCLRPDMLRLHMIDSMIDWALKSLSLADSDTSIHGTVGTLLFLNGIVASGAIEHINQKLPEIYRTVSRICNDTSGARLLQSSGVTKKLAIKIQRNVVLLVLQASSGISPTSKKIAHTMLETMGVLEDVIDYLLRSLADRDTQVRLAAAKSLSLIALKLEPQMAEDVVDAVIGSLNEDILPGEGSAKFAAVNPLRWHGLVMTLSHMLFRRTPSAGQVSGILEALYLALVFEQRSPSGSSIGSNVRDAANFGLWSLARRYSTSEVSSFDDPKQVNHASLQVTANLLTATACLDPVGNVRRGSSAALQELIGRHPNTILNGISLTQVVDFQAVGLRSRALTEIARNAAVQGQVYLEALIDGLHGWRGILAPDQPSRANAAVTLGFLGISQHGNEVQKRFNDIKTILDSTARREIEERQGCMLALAAVECEVAAQWKAGDSDPSENSAVLHSPATKRWWLNCAWTLVQDLASLLVDDMRSNTRRSETLATGLLSLINAASELSHCHGVPDAELQTSVSYDDISVTLTRSLRLVSEQSLLYPVDIAQTCHRFVGVLQGAQPIALSAVWLHALETVPKTLSCPAYQIALGAAWAQIHGAAQTQEVSQRSSRIVETLCRHGSPPRDIETRVISIRALSLIMDNLREPASLDHPFFTSILNVIASGLNDYTINERGDIGSLVRLEAIEAMRHFHLSFHLLSTEQRAAAQEVRNSLVRLALEKLDKVRLHATGCCTSLSDMHVSGQRTWHSSISDVSTYEHFYTFATNMSQKGSKAEKLLPFLEGFASSIGAGTSSVLEVARSALADYLDTLPTYSTSNNEDESRPLTLHAVALGLCSLISAHLQNDRTLPSILSMIAFLLDARILQRLLETSESPEGTQPFKWLTLLSLVQKSHYRSTSLPKLEAAVHVYAGLAEVPVIRKETLKKLVGMLVHPLPVVRVAAAEALWLTTGTIELKNVRWGDPPTVNKAPVATLKNSLAV